MFRLLDCARQLHIRTWRKNYRKIFFEQIFKSDNDNEIFAMTSVTLSLQRGYLTIRFVKVKA